ncbi:MAG TPA: Crp/Fnr family transcriptional regulator [Candidatus Blautia pullicola]|uniref:Crp/Fnr family transcriptional regulator n=1 Tax=Candidatus Blautia pullicola TaxID=2838498 RepID=A0A9D2FS35_9FIRM|nr:Crp/Fnr family transcriptional regulator [Candidatus Blautia pullicola]
MKQEERKIIGNSFLFREMEERRCHKILEQLGGYIRQAAKGQILVQEGDRILHMGILLEGEVRVCRIDFEGREKLLQKLRPPYMLAADVVCTPIQISPYTAFAGEGARIWFFPYSSLHTPGLLEDEDRLYLKERLLEFIANENVRKLYKVDMLSCAGARERILKYLQIQCRKAGSSKVEISYNREELANYLCLNRSVLSHTLAGLRKEGILEFRKNSFCLNIPVEKMV